MGRKGPKPKTYNHFQVTLDKFLGSKNLWRKPIAKDGSCLFRAVAEQVLLSQAYHHQVRLQCADYISRHSDDFKEFLTVKVDEYLGKLRDGQLWGGEMELVVLSKMYRRSIVVFNQQDNQVQEQIFYSPEDEAAGRRPEDLVEPIFLAYSDGNHYDSVYMKKHKSNMAFCQSVVYSMLYERVFEETLSQSSKQRLKTLYDSEVQKLATEDKGDKHLTFLSKTYPIGVLEGMGQNCFSNTPLHVYQRERESIEQQDRSVAHAIQFQVGDKCLVPVPGELSCFYNGEVSSPIKPNGCHMVYIFDVGEQWEIPCKDITVPTPSPASASAPVKRGSGPPQAWSKVHQRIQPGLPKSRQGSDDAPPAPSLPLPLPDHLLPIPSTASHPHITHHIPPSQLSTTTTPPSPVSEPNHTVPKAHQSLPKPTTTRASSLPKSHSKGVQLPSGNMPVSVMAPRGSVAKGGVIEVGVASQRVARKSGDGEHLKKEDTRRTQPQGRMPVLSTGLLGSAPPGFPAGKDAKTVSKTSKASEDKLVNLPGRVTAPDHGSTHARNPTEMKFPPQTTPVSVPPVGSQAVSNFTDQKAALFPTVLVKTPAGPRGSLSTSDESASSSDESSNGLQPGNPTQSTASTTPIPLAFFSHPMGRIMLPVLPEGQTSAQVPIHTPNAQVASVLERPLMHAPLPQSQPPRPLVQTLTAAATASLQSGRPVVVAGTSPQQSNVLQSGKEAGRESPYLEPQLRQVRSSQPEEAWPMVGEEDLRAREKLQDQTSSPASGPLPTRFMFPFGMPAPNAPDQAIPMIRPIAPHRPPRLPGLPGGPNPAGVPASMQQVFPFLFAHPSFSAHQVPQPEIQTNTREVQTSPTSASLSPSASPLQKDKEVDVRPSTMSQGVQCAGVNRREVGTSTEIEGVDVLLILPEDIKPPDVDEDSMDLDPQIEAVSQYALQCLELYKRANPGAAVSAESLVESLADSVHSAMETLEQKLREEVREEVRGEVREEVRVELQAEVREEVREELREEVREEVRVEVREEVRVEIREEVREEVKREVREEVRAEVREEAGVMNHKPLNMDEQHFLQLFTNAQQGLPESFQGGRIAPLEENGRQGGPFPNAALPNQEKTDSEEGNSINQTLAKAEGREDDAGLQPHQEASVPPYHQMAPSPMMVPPGARPMVVTMPGMPPMGWYPYMPFPMFMPPQMNMLPPVLPHMAPDHSPEEHSSVQGEPLPVGEGLEQAEEPSTQEDEVAAVGEEMFHVRGEVNPERTEGGEVSGVEDIAKTTADELPTAFPSADLQTDIDEIEDPVLVADSVTDDSSTHPPSPQTHELVTPLSRFDQSLSEVSPSPQPQDPPSLANTAPRLGGDETAMQLEADPKKELSPNPHGCQPGLPCRRRDLNDIDKVLEEGEQALGREEKEDAVPSPPTSQKQYPKGKSRQGGSHHNRSRDGSFHGGGRSHHHNPRSGHTGRQNQRYSSNPASASLSDQSPQPLPSTRQSVSQAQPSSPPDPLASSPTQPKTNQYQLQTNSSSGSGISAVGAEGVKKSAAGAKMSTEGVKSNGKDGADGMKTTSSGGGGGRGGGGGGGGRGGKGRARGGGRDNVSGSKTKAGGGEGMGGKEGSLPAPTKNEERERSELTTGETTEGKGARHTFNKGGYPQKGQGVPRQRKAGGGSGGFRSHRPPQQNNFQANSTGNQDNEYVTAQQTRRRGVASDEKLAKGESKNPKRANSTTTDSASSQQEPTRSGGGSSATPLPCSLAEPLPSFKNLYSSSPKDDSDDFFPHTQDSWPCFMTNVAPPSQYSPGPPTSPFTSICDERSSTSHHQPAQCTFDSNFSCRDVRSWSNNPDIFKFFPALLHNTKAEPAS